MFGFIKKIFIVLQSSIVNPSYHTKFVSLNNQKVINLHPNKYSQEFHYYPFAIKLDRCVGSCNTFNNLSNKVCVPNKTEDLNISMFKQANLIEQNVIQISGGIMINVSVSIKISYM